MTQRTIELTVTVDPDARSKREDLLTGIDVALCLGGAKVRAGQYRVTIERLPMATSDVQQETP